jgi:hypothetical protein
MWDNFSSSRLILLCRHNGLCEITLVLVDWSFSKFGSSLSTHIWNGVEIGQCWICAVLWWPFWKWRSVEIFRCHESIRDIIIYLHMKCRWQHCSISTKFHMMTWINSRHRKISKVAFDLFFKPVVSGRFGRLHNR